MYSYVVYYLYCVTYNIVTSMYIIQNTYNIGYILFLRRSHSDQTRV